MAAEQHFCERHHRPAVASRLRSLGRRSLFDDFFSDFVGGFGGGGGDASTAAPRREVERVDVTQLFSDATRELLRRAAQTALEWGSLDLESDHLLYAALQDDVVRHVLQQADADPQAIASQIEEDADRGERTDVSPSLSPDMKAALIAAYEESRELGQLYVGPEHVRLDPAARRSSAHPRGHRRTRAGGAAESREEAAQPEPVGS